MSQIAIHRRRAGRHSARRRHRPWVAVAGGALAVLIAAWLATGPRLAHAEEGDIDHVTNGTFTTGAGSWWNYGGSNLSAATGQLCYDLPVSTNPWDAGIGLDGLGLANGGSYTFTFTASASDPATVRAILEAGGGAQPFNEAVTLNQAPQTFSFTTTWPSSTPAKIVFQIGGNATPYTFCLDDVSVIGPTEVPPTPTPTPTADPYAFVGFFAPVDNLPTLNAMNAGRAVPVKFGLGGDFGLDVFAVGYPKSEQIACDSTDPVDGVEETVSASSSGLTYDGATGQYKYVWKTDGAWANTCRQLVLKLDDGTYHRANFAFV